MCANLTDGTNDVDDVDFTNNNQTLNHIDYDVKLKIIKDDEEYNLIMKIIYDQNVEETDSTDDDKKNNCEMSSAKRTSIGSNKDNLARVLVTKTRSYHELWTDFLRLILTMFFKCIALGMTIFCQVDVLRIFFDILQSTFLLQLSHHAVIIKSGIFTDIEKEKLSGKIVLRSVLHYKDLMLSCDKGIIILPDYVKIYASRCI